MSGLPAWIVGRIACDGPMTEDDLIREVKDCIRDLTSNEVIKERRAWLSLTEHGERIEQATREGGY